MKGRTWSLPCSPDHRYHQRVTVPGEDAILEAARAEGRKKLAAGIYCRMSLAAMNDTTKVDDQERICRELADRLGWRVAGVYQDNSKSAWQKNRKRPAWDQMLADVEAGKIGAIVVYHGDRLIRQPDDLGALLKLSDGRGVKLASPTGTRDLGNSDDKFVLYIEAAMAMRESDNTSRRRKSQYERWRREGRVRPGGRGGRAFGFGTDGVTQVEAECEVIREMTARVLRGEAAGSIARDVSARGHRTPAGNEFTHATVRKMLARPRYAGLMPDGESKAAWEPVLGRETWERVCLVLSAKAGEFGSATNARRWLLSGIAVCGAPYGDGECGTAMQVKPSKGRGRKEYATGYACPRKGCGKAYRSAPHLDAYVGALVVARLAHPFNPEGRAMPVDHAAEWAVLERERAETESLVSDFGASAGRARLLMARLDQVDARMAELRERAAGDSRARLLQRYAGITREQWEDDDLTPLSVRRALVAACFTVTVLPASGRGPGFRVQDVRVEPVR